MRRTTALALAFSFAHGLAFGQVVHAAEKTFRSEAQAIEALRKGGLGDVDAALWLGSMESAKGLRAIVATGDPRLVDYFVQNFPEKYSPAPEFPFLDEHMTSDLEAVIVATLGDAGLDGQIHQYVIRLAGERLYRSRALFDQLLSRARAADRRVKWSAVAAIPHTDLPGIEEAVLGLYRELEASDNYRLLPLFKERRYVAALPYIQATVVGKNGKPGQPRGYYEYATIAALGTSAAASFLADEIQHYRVTALDDNGKRALSRLMFALAAIPPETPLSMDRVIGSISLADFSAPTTENRHILEPYVSLLAARKGPETIETLVEIFVSSHMWNDAFGALMRTDDPDAWRRVRAAVEPHIDTSNPRQTAMKHLLAEMDRRIANPEEYFALVEQQRSRVEKERAAGRKVRELRTTYADKLEHLKERDPAKFAEAQAIYERMLEEAAIAHAAVRPDDLEAIIAQRERKAWQLRFTENKPKEAIGEMQAAMELERRLKRAGPVNRIGRLIWLADTWRFDLKDNKNAAASYKAALEAVRHRDRRDGDQLGIYQGFEYWLPHEIRYLDSGKRFSGSIGHDELATVGQALVFGLLTGRPFDEDYWPRTRAYVSSNEYVVARLKDAPLSQFVLEYVQFALYGREKAAEILRFLDRRDPARFLSAVFLARLVYEGKDDSVASAQRLIQFVGDERHPVSTDQLQIAAKRFRSDNNIAFVAYSDSSRSSPERTWRLFLSALKEQDLTTALSCFTPDKLAEARSLLESATPRQWRSYAHSLIGLIEQERSERSQAFTVAREASQPALKPDLSLRIGFERKESQWLIATTDVLRALTETAYDEAYERTKADLCGSVTDGCQPGSAIVDLADRFTRAAIEGDRLTVHYTTRRSITGEDGPRRTTKGKDGCASVNLKEMGFFTIVDDTFYSWTATPYATACDPGLPLPETATELPIQDLPEASAANAVENQRQDRAFLFDATASAPIVLARARNTHNVAGLVVARRSAKEPSRVELFELYVPWTRLHIR